MFRQKVKILIAEDNNVMRQILVNLLQYKGYTVQSAKNGREALDKYIRDSSIQLILTDMEMPEMSGIELIRELRANKINVPIIVLSGNKNVSSVIEALRSGANDYLLKEMNGRDILIPTIENILEKEHLKKQNHQLTADLLMINEELRKKNIILKKTFKQRDDALNRLNDELSQAAEYVKSLLPPPISEGPITADWRFMPSTSLGGDSMGYHWLDDDHFVMYLLDVSGHGIGAALLSVTVMNVLLSQSLLDTDFLSPSQVLSGLNNAFPMEQQNQLFFTIWYGIYNKSTHTLTYAESGHPPALLYIKSSIPSEEAKIVQLTSPPNIPIGIMPDSPYLEEVYELNHPCRLYVFSDGVFEISQEDGTVWSFEEFIDFMAQPSVKGQSDMDRLLNQACLLNNSSQFDDDFSIMEFSFN
ncbi:phosphoserine phosphatase RsbU/P [Candidatus Magnetomoraceae bacterium gMMP-15]